MSASDPFTAPLSAEERGLDRLPMHNEDRLELEQLGTLLTELYVARDEEDGAYEAWPEYFEAVLGGLPTVYDEEEPEALPLGSAAAPNIITATAGGRTYKLDLQIDPAFGGLTATVRRVAQGMLDQAVKDQTKCFYERAKRKGLTWRRSRNLPFPHPLPYRSPPPTTNDGRYQEEAAVVSAAVHFACTRPTPTVFHIKHFAEDTRVLGRATVNLYNRTKYLRISLNATRLQGGYSDATWSSVAAHEVLHNLGWGHPRGNYPASLAIEIYQHCIKGTGAGILPEETLNFIR